MSLPLRKSWSAEKTKDTDSFVGPGSGKNSTLMLPVLKAIIQRFQNGPNHTYVNSAGQLWKPSPLMAMFTNDGQINQLASVIGVFDEQQPLPATHMLQDRLFVASHFVPMKGTVGFERLSCGGEIFVRVLLNNVVYRKSNDKIRAE